MLGDGVVSWGLVDLIEGSSRGYTEFAFHKFIEYFKGLIVRD